jgi:hypothetical protein
VGAMSNFDLMDAVQPASGWYAIMGIKEDTNPKQYLVETRQEVDDIAARLVQQEFNVFFGVAKYIDDSGRKKSNVSALKSFWLDIDCGPKKAEINATTGRPDGYIDQATGLTALKKFCSHIGLPKPIVVNSGRGLHVYWPLTTEVSPERWEPVAQRLRELCNIHDLYVDPSVFETARILRIPGTYNFKDDTPHLVSVVHTGKPTPVEDLIDLLGVKVPTSGLFGAASPRRGLTALGKAMQQSIDKNFSKIIRRSAKGDGCLQLLDCVQNQATLSEARWFDALSIAKFCNDKDKAIHKLSSGHPEYDPAKTEQKIEHIEAPHNCVTFDRNNPGLCASCPHFGKIKNPITLGTEVKAASVAERTLEFQHPKTKQIEVAVIPEYPKPYFRGERGGIWKLIPADEAEPVFVYENDLYVVKRMRDPIEKDVVLIRLHMPRDGVREIIVPNTKVTDKAELRKILSGEGVMCPPKQFDMILDYLVRAVAEMQHESEVEHMRLQFGWADNDSKFIIGEREITAEGTFYSPPSTATAAIAAYMTTEGTLEKWQEVFNMYNKPGMEAHAFAALTAFGAPLLKFTGQSGAAINLINPTSGTGKTTALRMANSVYGNPRELCSTKDDTNNARILKLGTHNNLPFCVDEITNMDAMAFSDLIYAMSSGKGKDRMEASGNKLRPNHTKWQTISLCSSNASFYEKLASAKMKPDGEMMRMIEYNIDANDVYDVETAKKMFDFQLQENYGHAGIIYAEWLVRNKEEAVKELLAIQAKIDSEMKLTQRERFWSAQIAANITGGLIAVKYLKLIDFDMRRIYLWATQKMLSTLREDVKPPATDKASVIGDYLNRHINNILVVNDTVDNRTKMATLPMVEPRGELLVRYEPDTKRMFIDSKHFRNDCVKHQVSYKDTLNGLKSDGVYLGGVQKRMAKGMQVTTTNVYCLAFDTSSNSFLDVDTIVEAASQSDDDAGGGS